MPIAELSSYLITLIGLFLIIVVVAVKNASTKINRAFLLFATFALLYVFTNFVTGFLHDLRTGLLYSRLSLASADLIPFAFYLFTLAFTNYKPKRKWFSSFTYYMTPVLLVLAFLPITITTVKDSPYGLVLDRTGPTLLLTLIYFIVVFVRCFQILRRHGKSSERSVRLQINLMIFGIGADIVINLITQIVLPIFKVATWGAIVGTPANLLFIGSVGYAILRHKMFDIRSVILRSLGYLMTLGTVVFIYSALILGVSRFVFPGLHLSIFQQGYFIGSAVFLTLTFRPVVLFIERTTDKIFYRDHYDPQELINKIGRVLAAEINLEKLTDEVSKVLVRYIKTKQVDIVVLNKGKVYYESAKVFGKVIDKFAEDMAKLGQKTIVTDELAEDSNKALLRKYGIALFSILQTRNEKVGYLIFAEKSSGVNYANIDLSVIDIVSDELAIAIQNSRAYSQIQQFNVTLQAKVDEATRQLREANEHLKEADAVKDDFISMASHQLSTPLAVIDGYLALAIKGIYGTLNDKVAKSLGAASERAQVMKSLLADLLDISRMTAGKFMLEIKPTDLNELVEKEVSQLMEQAKDQDVKLAYHEPFAPLPIINIDAHKTGQAVMNLITNAIAYTHGGSVNVFLESDMENAIVRVVDNGIGVPDAQKSKLFSKFFRADNAKTERPTGTGIGLYLVKRVVEDQGGKIIFSSVVNKGSTFGFSLPLKRALPAEPATKPKQTPLAKP